MAYILESSNTLSPDGTSTFDVELSESIVEDDVLLVFLSQSSSSSGLAPFTVPSGWALVGPKMDRIRSQQQWAWKRCDGTEGGTTVTFGGRNDGFWNVVSMVIRDATTVGNPFVVSGTDVLAGLYKKDFPTFNSSFNGDNQLLIFSATHFNNSVSLTTDVEEDTVTLHNSNNAGANNPLGIWYSFLKTAGNIPQYSYYGTASGTNSTVAVINATGGSNQPLISEPVFENIFTGGVAATYRDVNRDAAESYSFSISSATDLCTSAGSGVVEDQYVGIIDAVGAGGVGFGENDVYSAANVVGDTFNLKKGSVDSSLNFTANVTGDLYPVNHLSGPNEIASTYLSVPVSIYKSFIENSSDYLTIRGGYNPPSGGAWEGITYIEDTSVDMTDKVLSFDMLTDFPADQFFGALGAIVIFADSTGNWDLFRVATSPQLRQRLEQNYVIAPATGTPQENSGTVDYADVKKISFLYHRENNNSNLLDLELRNVNVIDKSVLIGGSGGLPSSFTDVRRKFSTNGGQDFILLQGVGQSVLKTSLQIGNGVDETYFSMSTNSCENPRVFSLPSFPRNLWNVGEGSLDFSINCSDNDTVDFSNSILASDNFQKFTILPTSSDLATYAFNGCNFIGRDITWKEGITANSANFFKCKEVVGNGGVFPNCTFSECVDTTCYTISGSTQASLQSQINGLTDSNFNDNNVALRIEYTGLGDISLTLAGTKFSNNTTDIVYFASSASTLTLTPTDGANPVTISVEGSAVGVVIASGALLTLTGLQPNSEVRVYEAGTTTEVGGVENSGTSESFSLTVPSVDIVVHSLQYEYLRIEGVPTTVDTTIPIQQRFDRNYENP